MGRSVVGLGIAALLAGTLSAVPARAETTAPTRVGAVVADIGPGTNPYHEVFRRPAWTEHPCTVVPGLPCDMPALDLSLGSAYGDSLAADLAAGVWSDYSSKPGVVHWVPGTNLLLVTLRSWDPQAVGIHDGYGGPDVFHGLGTSAAMANSCPGCYVLVVQDSESADGLPLRHITANLPWVDFAASTNFPGENYGSSFERYARASQEFARTGRFFFAASGNAFVSSASNLVLPVPGYDLPPWVVMVGGALKRLQTASALYDDCNLVTLWAGKPPEFVGDFTQRLPAPETISGYWEIAGTSFATPQVAARFAHALVKLRERLGDTRAPGALWAGPPRGTSYLEDGRLTGAEVRSVLSRTAELFDTAGADLECLAAAHPLDLYFPASPTPWVEMGWGYVDSDDAEIAAAVIAGEAVEPAKAIGATAHMMAVTAARGAAYPLVMDAPLPDHGEAPPFSPPAGVARLYLRSGNSCTDLFLSVNPGTERFSCTNLAAEARSTVGLVSQEEARRFPTSVATYATRDATPVRLDALRATTGNIRLASRAAPLVNSTAGQLRVAITARATTGAGAVLTLGTYATEYIVHPGNFSEMNVPFSIDVPDELHLADLVGVELDVDVRGWHVLFVYRDLRGKSFVEIPMAAEPAAAREPAAAANLRGS